MMYRVKVLDSIKQNILLFIFMLITFDIFAIHKESNLNVSFCNGIAAVVNGEIITITELDAEENIFRSGSNKQLKKISEYDLRRLALQKLIDKILIRQESNKRNIFVSDNDIYNVVHSIASHNNMTIDKFRVFVEKNGLLWTSYLDSLRDEMYDSFLRKQIFEESSLVNYENNCVKQISNNNIESNRNKLVSLAQIFIRIPENATSSEIDELYKKASILHDDASKNHNFSELAINFSDGIEASSGGFLGKRLLDKWPDVFVENIVSLSNGEISKIIKSSSGFHILKMLDREVDSMSYVSNDKNLVDQFHIKHILVKKSFAITDEEAFLYLSAIRKEIISNCICFEDMAQKYSHDITAPQGGDMGWLTLSEMLPEIAKSVVCLTDNKVSEIITSPIGYHIIKLYSRRLLDIKEDRQEITNNQYLFDLHGKYIFDVWLERIRSQSYIHSNSV
ncbi:peptidylprolyl isomerase [Candidatus Kinetoplastidibacterium desouzai]|nr:peptidylprolyl isomerase [Candidatus Kinetoplastibacterium desouzaii]